MRIRCGSLFLFAVLFAMHAQGQIPRTVRVTGGTVQETLSKSGSIAIFKGIPYAAPPVGDLRWRAPAPVVPWKGARPAAQFGSSCIQLLQQERKPWTHEFLTPGSVSEDCLFVNVWTPAASRSNKLPVYVYLYGGGNIEGSSSVPVYDGEGLARKGIVVVTLNYRLGIFGFFAHPELTAEAPYHASGNYADLDIIAGLKWVQQNIGNFGGDPAKVTIGGQSAGSGHVHTMIASPLAKGLFRGAINESGTATGAEQLSSLAEMEKRGVAFTKAAGATSVADLRRMTWQQIVAANPQGTPETPVPNAIRFSSTLDHYVYNATSGETIDQGRQNDVPTIAGGNRDESGATPHMSMSLDEFYTLVQQRYAEMADEFLRLYPATTPDEAGKAIQQGAWDQNRTALYLWTVRRAKTAKTPVFTYFWEHAMPGPDAERFGAFHTSEVPYVMNTLSMSDRPFTSQDHQVSDTVSTYWANFIKTGTPNGPGVPPWPPANEKAWMVMEIGDQDRPIPVASTKERQDFMVRFLTSKPRALPRP